ncbi:MAG TPA: hypothetical protein VNJ71_02585 [Gemmatimonadales bacterium]|jgi:hypothetical protein|nr:hypothetical protein [Gemmatimonadales bacterium]
MPTLCLDPPYLAAGPPAGSTRPLGAVLLADLAEGLAAFADAIDRQRSAPWCPLALRVADPRLTPAVLATFEPRPGCFARFTSADNPTSGRIFHVLAAVQRRPLPTPERIAAYTEARLDRGVGPILLACMTGSGSGRRPSRTLSRRVQALGPYEVRDWRALARLTWAAALAGLRSGGSVETAAWEAGSDPRSLRRWVRLFTGLDWEEVRARVGWEWIVELALRRGGYVREPSGAVERKAS